MAFAAVRAEVKTILDAVTGVGKVHDYLRHSTTWTEIFSRHKDGGKINDWEITRESATQELIAIQGAGGTEPFYHDTHAVAILGRISVDDSAASEKTFQALIDTVVAAFRVKPRLNNVVLLPESLQVPQIGHEMFGGVLVHFARLTFQAVERVGG